MGLKSKISIRFYIKSLPDLKTEKNSTLIASLHFQGHRIVYYTGLEFADYQWNKQEQRFGKWTDSDQLNLTLEILKKEFSKVYFSLLSKADSVNPVEFRKAIKSLGRVSAYSVSEGLVRFMEENDQKWSSLTYKKFKSLYLKMSQFQEFKKESISLERFDSKQISDFYNFLKSKSFKRITIVSYINLLKWFLKYAHDHSWMINDEFRFYKFPEEEDEESEKSYQIYLYKSEVHKLMEAKLNSRRKEQIRDIFCLMCFTGFSHSEIKSLKKNDFDGKTIVIRNRKEREFTLNQKALEILNQYENKYFKNNSLLPEYSVITLNKYLRLIFTDIGLTRQVAVKKSSEYSTVPICQAASAGLARNTFMALAVELGISPAVVRKWSGNKTLSKYIAVRQSIESEEKRSLEIMNGAL